MNRGCFSVVFPLVFSLIALLDPAFVVAFSTQISAPETTDISLITPAPDSEIIAKRPEIICRADAFDSFENVMILLDGADVTGIIHVAPDGFSFKPVELLPPGMHTLTVMLTSEDGTTIQKEFSFSTRHSEAFEEAATKNNLSLAWEKTIEKPDDNAFQTNYKIESNLGHESIAKEKSWEAGFNTNLRYLTQNLAIQSPLEKGINLANYLFTGAYHGEKLRANTEIGDVFVSETQNTVNLFRRGGTVSATYDTLTIKTFAVNSEEVFGFRSGTGIGGSTDDHVMGVSGETGLYSDKVKLKTIYATGGEKGDSYSIYTVDGDKKGNVLGFLLSSNFFNDKFVTEAELDYSSYDADITDEFSDENDKACRLGFSGYWDAYSYGAVYERIGTDYQVIGNPYLQSDKKGATIHFRAAYPVHSAGFLLSTYRDNLDNNELYSRTDTTQGQIQYTFTQFTSFPLGLVYQRSQSKSSDEPEYVFPMENITDAISATANYVTGPWNFGFQTGFSQQDDKTPRNFDTEAANYSLSSCYYSEYISISPSASFNRSRYRLTGLHTDTKTATIDIRGILWDQRFTYECAGIFSRMESEDNSAKQDAFSTNFRIAYVLAREIWGAANPSAGFMGYYNTTEDYIYKNKTHDFTLLFVFSASMPFVM